MPANTKQQLCIKPTGFLVFLGLKLFLTFSNASFLADIFGWNGWICVNFWSDISLRSTHIFQEFGIFSNVNDGEMSTFQCNFLLKNYSLIKKPSLLAGASGHCTPCTVLCKSRKTPSNFYRHSNNYWRSVFTGAQNGGS